MVNTCDPEAVPLVEGQLITKRSSTYFYLACARFTKEINDPFQERCAVAGFLMGWLHNNIHYLICTGATWLDYACANSNLTI